jgi:hypothetical protein
MKWHAMLSDLSATFTAREGCYPQIRDGRGGSANLNGGLSGIFA